jgi:hypothetical protein
MTRKPKGERKKSAPPKKPGRCTKGKRSADEPISLDEYLAEHPEGFYVTVVPELKDAGLPYEGIGSEPDRLARDLELIEMGKAIGRHQRNRKSAEATIRRNIEICDLRKKDPKTWSFRRLARKYEIRWQSVQRIVAAEPKWRDLARRADT